MKKGVAIVGCGTAGLICAKRLAQLGVSVAAYDQKQRLGYPVKASGILSLSGLSGLGIGYKRAITNTLHGAHLHAGGEVMRIRAAKPQAHVLDRLELNELCKEEAEAAGATVVTGKRLDDTAIDALHKDNLIIGADGALSAVARRFGMGTIDNYVVTYKAEYAVHNSDDMVDLFFDNKIAPGFFGWLCPNSRDVLEVGIGIDHRHGSGKAAFDRFVKLREVSAAVGSAKLISGEASIIPLVVRRRIVDEANEVLLVGDAAGQVKPTTGGGIIFGGEAALTAAQVVKEHIDSLAPLGEYAKRFGRGHDTDLMLHKVLRSVYSGLSGRSLGTLMRASRLFGTDVFLGKYGDMDRPSRIVRRALTRQGA